MFRLKKFLGFTSIRKMLSAQRQVKDALAMFEKSIKKIDKADQLILKAQEEDLREEKELQERIRELQENQIKANDELNVNARLKRKFKEFTGGK